MLNKIKVGLLVLLSTMGLVLTTGGLAKADSDNHWEKLTNLSALTITAGFLFDNGGAGYYVSLNVASRASQGEMNGNMSYEPHNLHIKSQWCMNYHYFNRYLDGTTATTATVTECAPSNVYPIGTVKIANAWKSVNYDYDIVVTRYWGP